MGDDLNSRYLATAKRYHDSIAAVLLREWDPIGVGEYLTAQDEYDGYVHQIHGLLLRREPRHKLFEYLWWAETEHMGLCGNRQRTESIVDRLLQIRDQIAGSPRELR